MPTIKKFPTRAAALIATLALTAAASFAQAATATPAADARTPDGTAITVAAGAGAKPDPQTAQLRQALRSIKSSVEIPGSFRLLDTPDGHTLLVDIRGRYAVRDPAIEDMWSGETIRTPKELVAARSKIKFENLGLKFNELFSYAYGRGPQTIAVFVDPLAVPPNLAADVRRLATAYTIQVVPVAADAVGYARSRALKCSKTGGQLLLQPGQPAPLPDGKCDPERVQRNQILAKVFGFKSLPVVILPTGDMSSGTTALAKLPVPVPAPAKQ
jgi:hypothetical protein